MSEIVVTCGRLQMGKSSLAHRQASRRRGELVFDPTEAFDIGRIVRSAREMVEACQARTETPIVYRSDGEVLEDFEKFAQVAQLYGGVGVIVDEASVICSPHSMPKQLSRLVRKVARYDHDLFLTTHRPADLNPLCFTLAHRYQFFQTKNALDLDRIAEMTSQEAAERVSRLPFRHYLEWDVAGESFWVNGDPASWRPDPPIRAREKHRFAPMEAVNDASGTGLPGIA